MQTGRLFRIPGAVLALPVSLLLWSACEKVPEVPEKPDPPVVKPEPEPGKTWEMALTVTSPFHDSEVITTLNPDSRVNLEYRTHWNDAPTLSVWAKQAGSLYYVNQVEAAEMMDENRQALFKFKITEGLDLEKPFDLFGMACSGRQEGNTMYFRTELRRGKSFGLYFTTPAKQGASELMAKVAGTSERLFVINKTDKPIRFRHKGYAAEKVWYYTRADVSVEDGTVINAEQGEDVASDVCEVPPFTGENAYKLTSHYVPNGNKIVDAQLVAEIDGTEVRSVNRLTSDVLLQMNHCYGIFVTWDGEKLALGDETGDVSVVEIPDDAAISYTDLQILGDGKRMEMSEDGHFNADVSDLVAFHDNQVVYMSYGAGETSRTLNSTETAVSLLLPQIPLAVTDMEEDKLWVLKQMIGHLEPVKRLAEAIDGSIVSRGYMDIDLIYPELSAAMDELKRRLGLDTAGSLAPAGPYRVPSYPYFTNPVSKESYGDGFTIQIKDSKLVVEEGKKFWQCTVDLLNADRFCYTSFTKGYKASDGYFYRLDDSFSATFTTLVKPMNLSAFMDFGTLSDLVKDPKEFMKTLSDPDFDRVINQIWEPLKNLGHLIKGEETETVTYDKIKVADIDLRLYGPNEHPMVVGPGLDGCLLLFNVVKIVFQPFLKLVMGQVKKTEEYQNDENLTDKLIVGFVEWLGKADLEFRARMLASFTEPGLSWTERLSVVPEIEDHFVDFLFEEGLKYFSKKTFDYLFYMGDGLGIDDPAIKAFTTTFKSLLSAGDVLQLLLDIDYVGIGFELTQGQFPSGGGLDDVPGSDL